jgi:hypothetical protein
MGLGQYVRMLREFNGDNCYAIEPGAVIYDGVGFVEDGLWLYCVSMC